MTLSIITINYNNLEGLRKTIDSVLSQTWHDFKWIIIDGGSTDGSKELIEETANKLAASDFNPLSYWCSEPDNGIYNAMNKGIKHCKGEYVNFMNSGDCFYEADTLHKVFVIKRNADILYGYMRLENSHGKRLNMHNMKPNLNWYDIYYENFGHQSMFTRLDTLIQHGGFDETYKFVADWKLNILALVYGEATYEFLPLDISIYEGGGISTEFGKELDRLHKDLFPQMGFNTSIEILNEYALVNEYKFTQLLYRVARKMAKVYKKYISHD